MLDASTSNKVAEPLVKEPVSVVETFVGKKMTVTSENPTKIVSSSDQTIADTTKVVGLKFPEEQVRNYQWELAQPGLNGENYIFCAPTGSGKTLVAALIIKDHLVKETQAGTRGKVLFIVKTQQLAHQQKRKLEEYLNGVSVMEVTGETDISISSILPQIDIVVCTSGKLRAELRGETIRISVATLLVIDECHHTIGRDPYAEIMEHYLLEKSMLGNSPHVIAMSASLGAGSGKYPTLYKAISHQKKLCARLDATNGIKVVERYMDDLKKLLPPPSHESHSLPQRDPTEPVIKVISDTMSLLEGMLPQELSVRYDQNSQAYRHWIKNEIEAAQLSGAENQRDQIAILEHLEGYALARITYEDFEAKYATRVLQNYLLDDENMNETEIKLQTILSQMLFILSKIPKTSNPLLEKAEELLYNHFFSKPGSRGLFFVRDIVHTHYIVEWIKNSEKLKGIIRSSSICGNSRNGMSKEEQVRITEGFRSGEFNILSTTSVLEEGLDVPECNMVIRFQIMSNEIAEVQAQGRARANDSTMHTIITSNSAMHYNQLLNEEKKALADIAVNLVSVDSSELSKMQEEILYLREQRLKAQAERNKIWEAEDVVLLCRRCGVVACKALDVCKYGTITSEPQYIVPTKSFMQEKMTKMARKRPEPVSAAEITRPLKIGCVECRDEWGVWGCWKHSDAQYPILKCKSFTFHNVKLKQKENPKQWKLVPFNVLFYTEFIEQEDEI